MTIKAWKSTFSTPPGEPKEAAFIVGQQDPEQGSMYRGHDRYIGTEITLTGPSYRNNFEQHPADEGGQYTKHAYAERNPKTLFDYEPGTVFNMFSDARAPHTAGVAMGLAAQWHRQQGAERNVGMGMPTHDMSLSSDSAPIAKRLVTRGMIPPNPQGEPEVGNQLGRNSEFGTSTKRVFPEGEALSHEEMRGARETLREVMGKKRTAPIQTHTPPDHGEQQKLF